MLMEIEIALANIKWRKKVEMERKEKAKRDTVNNDEALPTQDGCCNAKPPSKKRGKQLSKEGIFTFLKRISNVNWMGNKIIPGATL